MTVHEIAKLKNLGAKSAEMFAAAGIHSPKQIQQLGAVGSFQLVKSIDPKLSLNFLWAVEGFLRNVDWREIPESRKQELLKELSAH